jgi:hypothetical protein
MGRRRPMSNKKRLPLTVSRLVASDVNRLIALTQETLEDVPGAAPGYPALVRRLLEAVVSLWAANGYLLQVNRKTKDENGMLYHLLTALLADAGGQKRMNSGTMGGAWVGGTDRRLCH